MKIIVLSAILVIAALSVSSAADYYLFGVPNRVWRADNIGCMVVAFAFMVFNSNARLSYGRYRWSVLGLTPRFASMYALLLCLVVFFGGQKPETGADVRSFAFAMLVGVYAGLVDWFANDMSAKTTEPEPLDEQEVDEVQEGEVRIEDVYGETPLLPERAYLRIRGVNDNYPPAMHRPSA